MKELPGLPAEWSFVDDCHHSNEQSTDAATERHDSKTSAACKALIYPSHAGLCLSFANKLTIIAPRNSKAISPRAPISGLTS